MGLVILEIYIFIFLSRWISGRTQVDLGLIKINLKYLVSLFECKHMPFMHMEMGTIVLYNYPIIKKA